MSAAAPGAHWQRDELVASYLDRRETLLPLIELQEEVVRRLIERNSRRVGRFVDLGAGDGAMSALVFERSPDAEGVLVDHSQPMLQRARARLARSGFRWSEVSADLNDPGWRELLPARRYDLAVSGLAIHHLPGERKRELFKEVYELLEPGALFVNMDYVTAHGPLRGLFDEEMRAKALAAEHAHGGTRTAQEVDLEDDHDMPDTVEDQVAWLRDAGFVDVETHFKWAEAAIFGGRRPEGAS